MPDDDGAVKEPPNSTVDDWFGQNVARDQEVADRVAAEEDDPAAAEERFDEEAEGKETYDAGHPRPDDEATADR
jgi:hypothetical protein